jgi:hypothetical protein
MPMETVLEVVTFGQLAVGAVGVVVMVEKRQSCRQDLPLARR